MLPIQMYEMHEFLSSRMILCSIITTEDVSISHNVAKN
jgi:hypothetical protein